MNKKLFLVLIILLAGGTIFAWYNVFAEYARFFGSGGSFLDFSERAYANPLKTPCVYGAIMYLIALVWALDIFSSLAQSPFRRLKKLSWLLLLGTLFAWGNFVYLSYQFYAKGTSCLSCTGQAAASPLQAPCFYGALIYSAALAVSLLALKNRRPEANN
jgi:hypothetical protein